MNIEHAHIFSPHRGVERPILVQAPADGDFAAISVFLIFVVLAREIERIGAKAPLAIKQEWLSPAHAIPLKLRARNRLGPKLLASTAESVAGNQIVKAGRQSCDVEVALVHHDRAVQPCVRVHTHAKQKTAGRGFLHLHQQVLVLALVLRVQNRHRGVHILAGLEYIKPCQVALRCPKVRIGEYLPRV